MNEGLHITTAYSIMEKLKTQWKKDARETVFRFLSKNKELFLFGGGQTISVITDR